MLLLSHFRHYCQCSLRTLIVFSQCWHYAADLLVGAQTVRGLLFSPSAAPLRRGTPDPTQALRVGCRSARGRAGSTGGRAGPHPLCGRWGVRSGPGPGPARPGPARPAVSGVLRLAGGGCGAFRLREAGLRPLSVHPLGSVGVAFRSQAVRGGRRRPGSRLLTPPHLPFALRGARTGSRPGCRPRRRPEPWGVASKSSSPQRLRLIRSRACWASSDTGPLASLPSPPTSRIYARY